ncbi:MAG: hypothetical protein F6K23_05015 [Okeania sp. SIO2C9]|uniref:hypothetical protein n=1 Tax=Okeania sp. SIO2C9 TaxID=2607791 RepID=UPI0013C22769|nr:hypothetical protein [Okeania sp. SIO2C9]NEQ72487.1 hypothetical protein [Okeania sp. SIO2C9]
MMRIAWVSDRSHLNLYIFRLWKKTQSLSGFTQLLHLNFLSNISTIALAIASKVFHNSKKASNIMSG